MKRYFILIILFVLFPLVNVNALSCYGNTKEGAIDVDSIDNFKCSEVEGDTLTFKHNNTDYSKYFDFEKNENEVTINIVDKSIVFDPNIEIGIVVINDGKDSNPIYINNKAYVKPTEQTTSTTTTDANEIIYTITLDPNNNEEKTTKTCKIKNEGDTCNITLPNLDTENFSGWGKAETCKEGSIGSIKVNEDTTYYACYTNNEKETETKDVLLKKLDVLNATNDEKIEFGTFSMKKTDYEMKVLYEVENLKIVTESDEGIKVEITGNENLVVGENEVIIKLSDNSNNSKEYKLKVTRLDEGETIDNVHYLEALVIGNYPLTFEKEKFVYNLTISNDIDKLEINPVAENEEDTLEIIGNENLVDGSSITINVTGSDELTTTYTINIIKESNNNILLYGAIGVIGLLIVLLIVLIIIKSKNNKNKQNKQNKQMKQPEAPKADNNIEVLKF